MAAQFEVTRDKDNEHRWGQLVLSWTLGKSQFPNIADNDVALPRSIDELKQQCGLAGVQFTMADSVTSLVVVQGSGDALVLRLPGREMTMNAIATVAQPNYRLPQFYEHFCGPLNAGPAERSVLLTCRIGDYSIANCA